MSFHYRKEVISPEVLQELYSLTPEQKAQKEIRDAQIRAIITGESDKFLLIIGPCSADHEDSVCEYITRLAKMQEKVEEKILIVPRIYTNKPRTTGEGYKGIVHQPDPEKAPDFMEGLIAMRKMHLRAISETGLFSAEVNKETAKKHKVLITTLTKRMAEDLTDYMKELGIRVKYLHSDIDTLERAEIIRDLRLDVFDVLVGINLLREGLDIPEITLVAILDADKEGFLRSELIFTENEIELWA